MTKLKQDNNSDVFIPFHFFSNFVSINSESINRNISVMIGSLSSVRDTLFTQAGNFGLRPGFHAERGVLDVVRKRGFGKHIDEHNTLTQNDFTSSVEACIEKSNAERTTKCPINTLYRATNKVIKKCNFPKKKFRPSGDKFALRNLNMSSSCGFGYKGSKGKNLDKILLNSLKTQNDPLNSFKDPMILGYRLQLRNNPLFLKLASTVKRTLCKIRIIFMYPAHYTHIESKFALPFIIHFLKQGNNTFYTIGKNGRNLSQLMIKRLKSKKGVRNFISLDISSWDQTLPRELILAAFAILRNQLQLTKFESILFNKMVQYFIAKTVLYRTGKDKKLTVIFNGMPSGSFFTNLIGTLCHAIILSAVDSSAVDSDCFVICSDDNIFGTALSLDQVTHLYLTTFGLTVSVEKSDVYKNLSNFSFLGYNWVNFHRDINLTLALNQCVWHSDFRVDLDWYERCVSRVCGILLTGFNGIKVFKTLYPEVISSISQGKDPKYHVFYETLPVTSIPFGTPINLRPSLKRVASIRTHLTMGPWIR